jgi:putative membrane protein|tara:strand:- start:11466 stop:12344 length:879 start_codon:yes stop_codon:yes gene_type:complete
MTFIGILARGLAMGAADSVPGVSGGTVAFLTGIYGRWLNVLTSVRPELWAVFRSGGIRGLWHRLDGEFLLPLLAGILVSLVTLSHLIKNWLEVVPDRVWGFFFGLVIAMGLALVRDLKGKAAKRDWAFFVLGCLAAMVLGMQTPQSVIPSLWIWPLAGAMALSAMLLPGISGSFLLLLTGLYPALLSAVSEFNLTILGLFLVGGVFGLLAMAHALKLFLERYETPVLCLLTGVVFGALVRVWPWQAAAEGKFRLYLPSPDDALIPLGCAIIGFFGGYITMHFAGNKVGANIS